MDPIEKRELKRKAWARLAAQRRRAGVLRGRVVVVSLICFALLWGIVFAQMATGNDPVLAAKEGSVGVQTASRVKEKVAQAKAREREARREREGGEERAQDTEAAEAEAAELAEIEAAEIVEIEAAEAEPLVTGQS